MAAVLDENSPAPPFKVAVNRLVVNKDKNFESLAADFQNYMLTQEQLANEINQGHAFTTHHEGRRNQDNFTGAGYIGLDFDKTSTEQMEEILNNELVKKYYGIFYHTPSSTPENPKFRLVFQLEKSTGNAEFYRKLVAAFLWKFSATIDKSCSDPCRFFYGSKGSNPKVTGQIIPTTVVESIIADYEKDQKYEENLKNQARKVAGNFTGDNLTLESKKKIFERILESHCIRIRAAEKGDRHYTLMRSARALGGYITGEPDATDEYEVRRRLEDAYSSHQGYNRREMLKAIDAGLRYGERAPLQIESLIQPATPPNGENTQAAGEEIKEKPSQLLWSLKSLAQFPKPAWLILQTIKKNSLAFLVGPPKCGKSFYSLLLALVIARSGGKVVYIGAEDPGGFYERGMAWCTHNKVNPDILEGNLFFWVKPVTLHDKDERDNFIREVKEKFQPDIIFVDTLAMNSFGLDENSTKDMGIFVQALLELRNATTACIFTIHHTNRAGEYRGSSALPGAADTFMMAETVGDPLDKGGTLKIKCIYQRGYKPFEDKFYSAIPVGDSLVLIPDEEKANQAAAEFLSPTKKEVLKILAGPEGKKGMKVKQICDYAGWDTDENKKKNSFRVMRELTESGFTSLSYEGKYMIYSITQKGRDVVEQVDLEFGDVEF